MSKNTTTRAQIGESLRLRNGQSPEEVTTLTFDGLEAALHGITTREIPKGYTARPRRWANEVLLLSDRRCCEARRVRIDKDLARL